MSGSSAGLLVAGFPGLRPDEGIVGLIKRGLAGVILFSRNIESAAQVRSLVTELQSIAAEHGHPPLLVAIDHEGGRVQRLRVPGVTRQPPAMALGATANPRLTRAAALLAGRELAWLGINCNLAPCADLNGVPRSQAVGTRAFGDEPAAVAGHVAAYVQGLQEAGVLAVAKHFPGHGATVVDSHFDLPRIERSVASLAEAELVPFAAAIQAGVAGVMPGHLVVPQLTGELPASLSRPAITGLLRQELGHQGLVISDCMEMQAIAARYSAAEASCRAVAAGTDLVLWSHTLSSQLAAIEGLDEAALGDGEFASLVAGALTRVRTARARLPEGDHDCCRRRQAPSPAAGEGLAETVARSAVTLVQADASCLPLPCGLPVTVIEVGSSRQPDAAGHAARFLAAALTLGGRSAQARILRPGDASLPAPESPAIILLRNVVFDPAAMATAADILRATGSRSIVVALGVPDDVLVLGPRGCALATYDDGEGALGALAEVLLGTSAAPGILPVST